MRTFILAICLSYFALSLRADALRDRMDAYVRRYADGDFFSGVVRVTIGDRIIYENAFGYADRAWQIPNSLQTKFQIASLSKPITAAAVLLLAEEGKLSLEDKFSKFVPDFSNGDKITIEELLRIIRVWEMPARNRITTNGRGSHKQQRHWWNARRKFHGKVSLGQPTSIVTRTITFWLS
jgi:hypothetical protein